jgi:hypothetical protein
MPAPIALRAVFGQDEVSHGIARFRVGVDGLLFVPAVVAFYLLKNAGFRVVKRSHAAGANPTSLALHSQLFVRMHHRTADACSYGGREYRVDENGYVLVPVEAAADLMAHGFVTIQPEEHSGDCSLALVQAMPPCAQPEDLLESYAAAWSMPDQQGRLDDIW